MITFCSKIKQIYFFFICAVMLASCSHSDKVDVSQIPVNIKIQRFDRDLDSMRFKPMAAQAAVMKRKYGYFYQDFIERILPAGSTADTAYFATLRKIFSTKDYQDLQQSVNSVYPNMDKQEAELTDAFRRVKYYFPQAKIPSVYAYFSGFQTQTTLGDGYFAVGLDMFLGEDSKFYKAIIRSVPQYISRRFTPAYIAPRVVEGYLKEDLFPERDNENTLLAKMVYQGKILYLMDKTLPDVADTVKIGYTQKQIQWCRDFKTNIWGYFLEENLLYETDMQKIQKYLTEAPFTVGLGEKNESAPKLGIWTGWQIVRQYMEHNPSVTPAQLMEETDAQKILKEAKYHPENND
jgi:gliding motility-associated lipoprotein GldB